MNKKIKDITVKKKKYQKNICKSKKFTFGKYTKKHIRLTLSLLFLIKKKKSFY